jgi:hypothetical protein
MILTFSTVTTSSTGSAARQEEVCTTVSLSHGVRLKITLRLKP